MRYRTTPPEKTQTPLDDAPAHAIPGAMSILRSLRRDTATVGLIYRIEGRAAAMAALHSAALVDLTPTRGGMYVMRRAAR